MKISISKKLLESILTKLQPFLEKRDLTEITSHIYMEAKNDLVMLKATDNEIGLIAKTDNVIVEYEGKITANGKKFLKIIQTLRDEDIILELIEDSLIIKQNKSKFKIPIFNPNSFPKFPKIQNGTKKLSLNSMNLIQNLKLILPAIDTHNPKFELNGALIDIKGDSVRLVGTDTRRLAMVKIENSNQNEFSIIIPKRAISEIKKLFINELDIYYNSTNIMIKNRNYFFFSRLINGKFPNYERVIPKDFKYHLTLPKKEMTTSIKTVTIVSEEIKLIFNPDSIVFKSLSSDNIDAKTELLIDTNIYDRFELNVNSRYLLDFISQVDSEDFEILLNESTLPFVLRDKKFITVVMPIIV